MTVLGAAKVPFFNRDTLAGMLGLMPTDSTRSKTMLAAASARAASSIPKISSSPSPLAMSAARCAGSRTGASISQRSTIRARRIRGRDRLPPRRHDPRHARRGLRRHRRLYPHPWRSRRAPWRNASPVPTACPISVTSTAPLTNKTPSGTYRAPGRFEGSFFCERLIELAARDLGIDSAEMRRRNLIGAGEMPYRLPRRSRAVPPSIPSATAATIERPSNAALPSSAGRKSVRCKAAKSTGAITASPSPVY